MEHRFTLEYWKDGDWYVGRLKEVPGVFSQGESLEELKENVREAYHLMIEDDSVPVLNGIEAHELEIEV